MLYSKEEPYELCLNLQKKIRDKKEKIERIKQFLESSKDSERELLNEEIKKDILLQTLDLLISKTGKVELKTDSNITILTPINEYNKSHIGRMKRVLDIIGK